VGVGNDLAAVAIYRESLYEGSMALEDKSEVPRDPVEMDDGGRPRLLDAGAANDDPAAGRDARDLLDPKNSTDTLELDRRRGARREEGRREDDPTRDDIAAAEEARRRGRPEWLVRPSPGTVDDPLLGCLAILATLLDRPMSSDALTAGLPMAEEAMSGTVRPRGDPGRYFRAPGAAAPGRVGQDGAALRVVVAGQAGLRADRARRRRAC